MSEIDVKDQEEQSHQPVTGSLAEHPADLADRLQHLAPEDARDVLLALPVETASAVLAEMDESFASEVISEMASEDAGELLDELSHDETADIVGELTPEERSEVLAHLEPEDSQKVAGLLRYPDDSAGGIMSDEFVALPADSTIIEAQAYLRERAEELEEESSVYPYLYVVDAENRLQGVIRVRDLIFRKPDRRIREVMMPDVKFVYVDDDQETVARLIEQYHFLSVPVLERDGRLMGVISADTAIDVIQEEATEDMQLMVGVSGEERIYTPWARALAKRLPWLYVNTCTAFLAATVISLFEGVISHWTALAIFLPIVAGQGGNAGMQTLTVIIRGMALGEIDPGEGRRALRKEVTVGLLNGLAVGLVVGFIGYVWKGSVLLGAIVSAAMFFNMLAAAVFGTLIPLTLRAFRVDPAMASSIFMTAVTDAGGFFFFLGLAALALRFLG